MCVCLCSIRPVVCRCIELFVQQTSLICPLSEAGKLRLAADYAQLEASLSPLCHKLSDLGRPYRMIRAIRSVLSSVVSFFQTVCPFCCQNLSVSLLHDISQLPLPVIFLQLTEEFRCCYYFNLFW